MTTKLTAEQYKALNSGKRKPGTLERLEKLKATVRKRMEKLAAMPDPREKNYPEDLEGLTEGERKLMKR